MVLGTQKRSEAKRHQAVTRTRKADEPLKIGKQQRFFPASDITVERKDDVVRMSFACSSEAEVERWWGTEILQHDADAVRMDRINKGAVPVLFNHNYDMPVGIVEGARLEKKRLVVDTKWLKTDDAVRVVQMVEGGLRNVSIGYRIHAVTEEVKEQRFTAVDWEPFEVSIVTVPADPNVGIGRQQDDDEMEVRVERSAPAQESPTERSDMKLASNTRKQNAELGHRAGGGGGNPNPNGGAGAGASAGGEGGERGAPGNGGEGEDPAPRISGGGNATAEIEAKRIRAIKYFAQANAVSDAVRDHWIHSGTEVDQVGEELVRIQQERNKNTKPASHLGMEDKEIKQFSIARAIHAVSSNNWNKAGLEAKASQEIMQRMGFQTDPNKFYVPLEVQQRTNRTPIEELTYALVKRDLTVATAGAGGFLVETANVGFVDLLRNRSVAFQMGATRMPGMVGNLTIPKQSAAGSAFWLANEATQITESQQTFVQIALAPKTVGGYTEISRQLLLQSSPAAEGLVMADLAAIVALAADLAILSGSGAAGQPTGITNTAGIGAVTGTSLAYPGIIEFQTDTAAANALFGASGYVTTPAVAGLLKQRVKFTNTASPLWDGQLLDANVDGYRGMASNQMAAATMLFGFFAGVLVPEWGVLAIEVNPFANFQAGIVGVRAMYTIDVGVRYPTAFSLATVIT